MHKKSRTVVCKQPYYGMYGYVNVRCLLEARTVLQGEVPTGWVGNTVRCTRGRKEWEKVSRTVLSERCLLEARTVLQGEVPTGCFGNAVRCIAIGQGEGKNGKSIPYGSKRGRERNFKPEARTG